jgi:hypothetical protein
MNWVFISQKTAFLITTDVKISTLTQEACPAAQLSDAVFSVRYKPQVLEVVYHSPLSRGPE